MSSKEVIFFNIFNTVLGISLSIGAIYIILKDYRSNKFIKNNSNTILLSLFFLSCIISYLINGNGFRKFNNIYFVIHSLLFFFVIMTLNKNVIEYKKLTNYTIMMFLTTLSLISLITILIFLSNKTGFTDTFKSNEMRNYFHFVAKEGDRWNTILKNSNTYAHLISMSFFLSIIPFITIKKNSIKASILIMTIFNVITLLFSGSKGAILAVASGSFLLLIYILTILYRQKKIKLVIAIISVCVLIPVTLTLLYKSNNEKIVKSFNLLLNKILRVDAMGNGRVNTWKNLLSMDLFPNLWGYNDEYIYKFLKSKDDFFAKNFINNSGRAHNIILQVMVSFGSISLVLFISSLLKTVAQYFRNIKKIASEDKLYVYIFAIQFVTILVGGMFEQLPLFNLSAHSLLFMFVWANLLTLTETNKQE
ncbi:MAG: O-antigen ligase family protein [Sphaerochaeta sp.]